MKLLLVTLGVVAVVQADPEMMKRMMDSIHAYNIRSQCWGEENVNAYHVAMVASMEKCMQLAPALDLLQLIKPLNNPFQTLPAPVNNPFQKLQTFKNLDQLQSLWRSKRQASSGLLDADETDFIEFLQDFQDFKNGMASKMSNLTCVLTEMEMLTSDLKINMDAYTVEAITKPVEGVFKPELSVAGKDPAFAQKLADGFQDCYKISQNWPQASLNRSPMKKIFGRHMIFFKCAHKKEMQMCAKAQMLQWLETIYGTDPEYKPEDHGLPEDKYDAAAVSIMVLDNSYSPEEKFVGDFFWGMEH